MLAEEFASLIISNLPYSPNDQQRLVIGALSRFCSPQAPSDSVFLLNGYAGTGKSSLCGALVRSLPAVGLSSVLLAPTGRAAKVFGAFAGRAAFTIHRMIYRHSPLGGVDGGGSRTEAENRSKNTVFIVDEASMITGDSDPSGNVLEDLIHYVYTGDNCRMILIGDTAQLPPVGCEFSPAMSPDVLRGYGLRVSSVTLTDIARQGRHSGILRNATWLRRAMRTSPLPLPKVMPADDVREISPEDMPECLYTAYSREGVADTIVITRSNQRALGFNREIRASVLYLEEELTRGEMLIVAKNNYFWTSTAGNEASGASAAAQAQRLPFLANGDIVEVTRVIGSEYKYGMQFADVMLSIHGGEAEIQVKVMLDALRAETANMPTETLHRLYYAIMEDPDLFGPYTPADARLAALKKNPYWNALQVKYAYAVTCHKAQGGQWSNVFVDMTYIPAEAMGLDFYRWLYTAETRATHRLFLIR